MAIDGQLPAVPREEKFLAPRRHAGEVPLFEAEEILQNIGWEIGVGDGGEREGEGGGQGGAFGQRLDATRLRPTRDYVSTYHHTLKHTHPHTRTHGIPQRPTLLFVKELAPPVAPPEHPRLPTSVHAPQLHKSAPYCSVERSSLSRQVT